MSDSETQHHLSFVGFRSSTQPTPIRSGFVGAIAPINRAKIKLHQYMK
ncbi:MAG: hypothetical protein RMX96_30635 [Nostoc sp. ChiSLP02]|nr:hypothetical protein [Nostoc sp. DedSLP05]MDZ8098040.1 hypothetical protein [Nostoc sp. DedSLP01]MDZ8189184.1 hypothetical protein [Nostoc sp. ChiSLP02]